MELRTRYEIHRLDLIAYIIQSGAEVDNFYRITRKYLIIHLTRDN